jgi:uncharacterized protein YmfQ (DUF2313 family)
MSCYLGDKTKQQMAASLANFLPNDRLFEAKCIEGSKLNGLLIGWGRELLRCNESIEQLACNYLISTSGQFLPEWELLVGIPDDCFLGTGTETERMRDVLIKLASLNVITEADWEALCGLFGVSNCIIRSGREHQSWDWLWPHIWFSNEQQARFTMIINLPESFKPSTWPWTWPHVWGQDGHLLECLLNKVKPADNNLIFLYTPL